jgi:nucleotide-binding universal stress UspA family protein
MKRIIVPIDFSPYSEWAFLSAVNIAEKTDASITCVNVVTANVDWKNISVKDWVNFPEIMDLEEEATDKLNAFVRDKAVPSVPVEAVVGVGIPYEVIIDIAHQHRADLIVIGAYGKGYQEGRFIGSNLQKVIRLASCPVLAVRKVLDKSAMEKVTFASLFNQVSKPAFNKMLPLIREVGRSVDFLYINLKNRPTAPEEIRAKMATFDPLEEGLVITKSILDHQEAEQGIIDYADQHGIGWIGIASNPRKTNSTYTIGVTETLIYRTDIPVLSVKVG